MPLYERIALYSVADVAVVTATRDGMNLVPYEYIVCRQGMKARHCPPALWFEHVGSGLLCAQHACVHVTCAGGHESAPFPAERAMCVQPCLVVWFNTVQWILDADAAAKGVHAGGERGRGLLAQRERQELSGV